jgi:hypothetical protein
MAVLVGHVLTHPFKDLSGVRKERPHVGPHKALKPAGGDVRDAVGGLPPSLAFEERLSRRLEIQP